MDSNLDFKIFLAINGLMFLFILISVYRSHSRARRFFHAGLRECASESRPAIDLLDHVKLTGRLDADGFCHCRIKGADAVLAPSSAPSFDFETYTPDIVKVLNEKPQTKKKFKAIHRHICYCCHEAIPCIGITLNGHRVICTICQEAIRTIEQTSELNYQQTIEAIYEFALSSGAPENPAKFNATRYLQSIEPDEDHCVWCRQPFNFLVWYRPARGKLCRDCLSLATYGRSEEKDFRIVAERSTRKRPVRSSKQSPPSGDY